MDETSSTPVFILAGGGGTPLATESMLMPKPMIEIGGLPILLHIIRSYYSFGFSDFIVCAGYKSWVIKDYFINYLHRFTHLEVDTRRSHATIRNLPSKQSHENWRVRILETGHSTATGARLARAIDEISATQEFQNFALSYGDGLCSVNLGTEFDFHRTHGKLGTVLTVKSKPRFGHLQAEGDDIVRFLEKSVDARPRANGGYFFFKKEFRNYLTCDEDCALEREPLENLAKDRQLKAFRHPGFWISIDTPSDKIAAQSLWAGGDAPWARPPYR